MGAAAVSEVDTIAADLGNRSMILSDMISACIKGSGESIGGIEFVRTDPARRDSIISQLFCQRAHKDAIFAALAADSFGDHNQRAPRSIYVMISFLEILDDVLDGLESAG